MNESPVFVKAYDLLKWLLQATGNFPRSQRFVTAQRIQRVAFDMHEALVAAGTLPGRARAEHLARADIELAKLRFYLRLSHDMSWLSLGQYEHASRMADEVGRLIGGWRRKEREQRGAR